MITLNRNCCNIAEIKLTQYVEDCAGYDKDAGIAFILVKPRAKMENLSLKPSCELEIYDACQSRDYDSTQISVELEKIGVSCHLPWQNEQLPLLVILDRSSGLNEAMSLVQQASQLGRQILVLYLGKEKLPFHYCWELLNAGAEDIIFSEAALSRVSVIHRRLLRWRRIEDVLRSPLVAKTVMGKSAAWVDLLRQIIDVAIFTRNNVLIIGETGTGKELIARLIHELDTRREKGAFVVLDCTTIVPSLSGSEFFGHEKGSFTNAIATREGAFALAHSGTLFLDEVGELPLPLQAELLRVIQEGSYKRVGSNQWRKADFRLICATHHNLTEEAAQGKFRPDLYYRIATSNFFIPALCERRDDILELTEHFLREALGWDYNPVIDNYLRSYLCIRDYPGNVRELRQLILRVAARYPGDGPVTIGCLPVTEYRTKSRPEDWKGNGFNAAIRMALADGASLKGIKHAAAEIAMDVAIEEANGNLHLAAQRLDVTDRTVQLYLASKHLAALPSEQGRPS